MWDRLSSLSCFAPEPSLRAPTRSPTTSDRILAYILDFFFALPPVADDTVETLSEPKSTRSAQPCVDGPRRVALEALENCA